MTDTRTTIDPENPESAIAVIKEKVLALADPSASLNEIGQHIGDLWNDAEARGDDKAIAFLQSTWDKTQALVAHHTAANAVAQAALQTATELADAIPGLVEEAFESGLEYAQEGLYEQIVNGWNGELYLEEPGFEVLEVLSWEIHRDTPSAGKVDAPCSDVDADNFMRYLCGKTPPLGPDLARKVAAFITAFGADFNAQIEIHNAAMHAEREAALQRLAENGVTINVIDLDEDFNEEDELDDVDSLAS